MKHKRLSVRYNVELEVRVTGALWSEPTTFIAKDVSRGGMFVVTDEEPEPFSELRMTLCSPAGRSLELDGRVVHVMTGEQARQYGVQPGLGIEFHRLEEAQRVELERLLAWAKDHDESRVVPVRSDERPPGDLDDESRAVLMAVDDESSTDEIAAKLELAAGDVDDIVRRLAELDLVFVSVAQLEKRTAPRRLVVSTTEGPASSRHVARAPAPYVNVNAAHPEVSVEAAAQSSDPSPPVSRRGRTDPRREEPGAPASRRGVAMDKSWRQRTRPGVGPRRPIHIETAATSRRRGPAGVVQAVAPSHSSGGDVAVDRPRDAAIDIVQEHLSRATVSFERGDVDGAKRALDLLNALDWDRPELVDTYEGLRRRVAIEVAVRYERQATQEEQAQRWKQAARSWQEVCRGRPEDPECHRRAALALLEVREDLRRARDLAQRAVDLAPRDGGARRALGHIYLEAGLHQNARRELQLAATLCPGDELTQQLLRRVAQAQAAREQ